uniref:Uncharacterized protein n=1 Tax=Zea mays TaxID=4577 RepID=C4J7T9_MAIZE|nr:unknown [Zea mays]|eukprot:NP_001183521.1 uncharacterized protein LOC100502013 [Zea mays]
MKRRQARMGGDRRPACARRRPTRLRSRGRTSRLMLSLTRSPRRRISSPLLGCHLLKIAYQVSTAPYLPMDRLAVGKPTLCGGLYLHCQKIH